MKRIHFAIVASLIGAFSLAAVEKADNKFSDSFNVDKGELSSVGTTQFFILAPGYQLVLEGKEGGKLTKYGFASR